VIVTFHIFNDQTTSQPLRQLLSCCISLYYTRVNFAKFSFIAVVAYLDIFTCHSFGRCVNCYVFL